MKNLLRQNGLTIVRVSQAVCSTARQNHLILLIALMSGMAWAPTRLPAQTAFSFDQLRERARDLAAKEYRPETKPELPEDLKKLDYDAYQNLQFRPEHAPWHNEPMPFRFQFFHRGFLFKDPVRIHLVEGGQAREFAFSPDQFNYDTNRFPKPAPPGLHFAGLRVFFGASQAPSQNEVASFLGASYFRIIGLRQRYGASARGLAIDTAEATGEEFPRFTEFWIEKPGPQANFLQVFALLDSPSITGAYRFVIKPGENTAVEIETSLFPRKEVKKLGLLPLTSMYLMGENRTRYTPDFRPEVHDSDGLLMQAGAGPGEWLWRPLANPEKQHQVSRFPFENMAGFGLLQRDRDFRSYEDLAARYELRPSLWVQPRSTWGAGAVELVEIPTPSEYNDNIVAYWVPKQKPVPGQELRYSSTLTAYPGEPSRPPLLRVQATRIHPGQDKTPPRFVLDFTGDTLPALQANAPVTASLQVSQGEARDLVVQRNEVTGGWRAFFNLVEVGNQPAELRLFLRQEDRVLSETWLYTFHKP